MHQSTLELYVLRVLLHQENVSDMPTTLSGEIKLQNS